MTCTLQLSAERGGSTPRVLHEILQKGDAAVKYMKGSRNMKIDNWILLDNYVQGRALSSSSQTRALRIHSKRFKKHMSLPQEFHQ
jgi:ribonuclease P protein subunit POP4